MSDHQPRKLRLSVEQEREQFDDQVRRYQPTAVQWSALSRLLRAAREKVDAFEADYGECVSGDIALEDLTEAIADFIDKMDDRFDHDAWVESCRPRDLEEEIQPIKIDPDSKEIIDGHARAAAAARLGWDEIPVKTDDGLLVGWTCKCGQNNAPQAVRCCDCGEERG